MDRLSSEWAEVLDPPYEFKVLAHHLLLPSEEEQRKLGVITDVAPDVQNGPIER